MKLFRTSQGFIISFGFDMVERKPDPTVISWCDPSTGEWEAKPTNQAGCFHLYTFDVAPEFVCEYVAGSVIAYRPGLAIEMTYVGTPMVWHFKFLSARTPQALRAA